MQRVPDRWYVKLLSESEADLAYLARRFNHPSLSVMARPDGYWMTSDRFRRLEHGPDVREAAIHLLRIAAGLARFHYVEIRPVRTAEILGADARGPISMTLAPMTLPSLREARARAGHYVNERGEVCDSPQLPSEAELLERAAKDPAVRDALAFYSHADEWWSLYKVYEVIAADLGQDSLLVRRGVVSDEALRHFKTTANDAQLGYVSRHARVKGNKPEGYQPMTLEDGKILIGEMMARWLSVRSASTTG